MTDHEPHLPFTHAEFGDKDKYDQLGYPSLNDDGTIHLIPEDGATVKTLPVRTMLHYHQGLKFDDSGMGATRETNTVRLYHMEMLVTDARVVLHCLDSKKPGHRIVGQLWYPWIAEVAYRPKQSYLNEAEVQFAFLQHFPNKDDGMWWHRVTLQFEKTFDTGELAREIVQRLAAHHLRLGVPEVVTAPLEELREPAELPNPPKGGHAAYEAPAYVAWPGGVPYIERDEQPEWEWTIDSKYEKS